MNPRHLLSRLSEVANFQRLQAQIAPISGWLDDLEDWLLHLLVAEGLATGAIVEIGSWMGRSPAWLVSGSK